MADLDLSKIQISEDGYPQGKLGPNDEMLPAEEGQPQRFRRKVIRHVEVPFKRLVKVPVVTKEVVECEVEKRVLVKKYVEKAAYEEVEETYTEFEERSAQREKKVWKEVVEQKEEVRKRPVQKTRMVKRPITKFRKEKDVQIVKVPSTRKEEVQGWRLDKWVEYRQVEQVDWEVYELMPHATGQSEIKETRELGRVQMGTSNRVQGHDVYTNEDVESGRVDMTNVEADDAMSNAALQQQALNHDSSGRGFSQYEPISNEQQHARIGNQSSRRVAGEGDAY